MVPGVLGYTATSRPLPGARRADGAVAPKAKPRVAEPGEPLFEFSVSSVCRSSNAH